MATDTTLLQGEVNQEPDAEVKDVERLLIGFLRSLLSEQDVRHPNSPAPVTATAPEGQA